jgi:putative transposase
LSQWFFAWVDVLTAQGKSIAESGKTIAVTETTYFCWRSEYGGLKSDQAKRLKELENAQLRRAVPDLTLDKLILTEAANPSMASAGQMH